MWSAIPIALLWVIVNLSEWKQGVPEGDRVQKNTGLSFVLPEKVYEML